MAARSLAALAGPRQARYVALGAISGGVFFGRTTQCLYAICPVTGYNATGSSIIYNPPSSHSTLILKNRLRHGSETGQIDRHGELGNPSRDRSRLAHRVGPPDLHLVDALQDESSLKNYHLLPSVRGDLLAKLGRNEEARHEFEHAAKLTRNVREQDLLLQRVRACDARNTRAIRHKGA